MKKLQENKKNDVISLLNTGKSVRQVAEILHVSKPIVGKIKKQCCRSLGVSKGGRHKLLSKADERFCVRQATKNAAKNASNILKLLESNVGVNTIPETVRRVLRRGCLGAIIKPKKPVLSPANIKKRLEWCHLRKD